MFDVLIIGGGRIGLAIMLARETQRRFGVGERDALIGIVEDDEDVALLDRLRARDADFLDRTRNERGDLRRIGADIGVVGVDAPGLRQEVPDAPQDRDRNHDDRENAEQLLSLCAVGLGVRRFGGDFGSAAFGRSRFVGHHSSPVGLLATYPPPSARIRAMSRESCRASSSATARSSATMLSSAVSWTI